jgi:hypothetical protein
MTFVKEKSTTTLYNSRCISSSETKTNTTRMSAVTNFECHSQRIRPSPSLQTAVTSYCYSPLLHQLLIVGIEEHHNFIQLFGQTIAQKPKY